MHDASCQYYPSTLIHTAKDPIYVNYNGYYIDEKVAAIEDEPNDSPEIGDYEYNSQGDDDIVGKKKGVCLIAEHFHIGP